MARDLVSQYNERAEVLARASQYLESEVREALKVIRHVDRVYFRRKETKSFVDKATDPASDPPYTEPLIEIEDQIAGRVIVLFLQDIPEVVTGLSTVFNRIEHKKRRPVRDAEFGYQSEHLICIIPPQAKPDDWDRFDNMPNTFELQIRTIFMHAYAEPEHDLDYKGSLELPADIRRELAWVAASAWGADRALQRVYDWYRREVSKKSDPN